MPPPADDFAKRLARLTQAGKRQLTPASTPIPTAPTSAKFASASARAATAAQPHFDSSHAESEPSDPNQSTSHTPTAEQHEITSNRSGNAVPVGVGDHLVRDGECVSSIAKQTGHFWQTLWDDPANTELKSIRKQPNVLMPGDRLSVPPLRPKLEPGATEMRHRFVRRGEPSHFATRILDQDEPRANQPFKLVIDEKQTITGFTDPEGKIDVPIPGTARLGLLTVGDDPDILKLNIRFGGLDPVETCTGLQTRLKNLGFACEVTGNPDAQTMDAVNEFRDSVGLAHSPELDDETRNKLKEKHGS